MNRRVVSWVAKACRDYPLQAGLLLVLSLLTSLADGLSITMLIPLLATLFQDQGLAATGSGLIGGLQRLALIAGPENSLMVVAGLIVGLVSLRATLSYWHSCISAWMSEQISHQIRSRIHANLLGVDYQFIVTNDNGKLLNTLDGEAWNVTDGITSVFGLFTNLCMVFAFTTLLVMISWQLTVIVAVLVIGISLLRQIINRRVRGMGDEMLHASEDLYSRAVELLDGMRMIRAFGRERDAQRMYEDASIRLHNVSLRINNLSALASTVQEVLSAFVFAGLIFVAVAIGVGGASLVAFLALLHRVQPEVRGFDETRTHLQALNGSITAVSRLLDLEQWSDHANGDRSPPALVDRLAIDDVRFSYAGKSQERRNALDGLTLEIPFGKTTALVGSSGAGKSTLTNLLFRFHDPEAGRITVDGVPLNELDLDQWRARLSIAGQDTDLVSGTIRDNIAYADPDASDGDVEQAARDADIHEFITTLPMGYQTQVGTRGILLSGGQRQRLQLARALLRKDGILILDEATNALDSMTENEVHNTLQRLHHKRTIILIAHRLSSTRMADNVIVLADGKAVEQGAPSDLYRMGGTFAQMVRLQEIHSMIEAAAAPRSETG